MILSASCLFDDHDCEMLECNLLVIVRTELFVVASETIIVICLSLSWCGSFNKSFVDDHDCEILESNRPYSKMADTRNNLGSNT